MQAKSKRSLSLILLVLFAYSCDDVFEEDISNDLVQIISPTNNTIISGNTVAFTWQALEGADNYRIQVTESANNIVLDSLVSTSNFNFIINPGDYQWRVRGENFAYQTAYSFPSNFTVEISQDLTNQTIALQTPSANLYSNASTFVFTWDAIVAATSYDIEIVRNDGGLQTVFQQSNITENTINVEASIFDVDAEYIWKVRGVNNTSTTNYSERSLFVDRTSPNQPTLVSPTNMQTESISIVTFNWDNGSDTGNIQSQITNTIEIATDVNFSNIIDTTNTVNSNSQYEFTTVGSYYWRVRAEDAASNVSVYSTVWTLVIE